MQKKSKTAFSFCNSVLERIRMNSFMSWVGGKKALRDAIVTRLPNSCDRYVEVFGGGGWVLFHKTPGKFEVDATLSAISHTKTAPSKKEQQYKNTLARLIRPNGRNPPSVSAWKSERSEMHYSSSCQSKTSSPKARSLKTP